mmetsp:Transcript_18159/g.42440  ORF Transcript_18159/g.42440 Transcript_18159/m.42440 type:complete len:552 (-) Transcript_18159:8-1663(-)
MGKNQHSTDRLHLRPTEWAQDGRGFKKNKRSPFAKLPLHCCFLSQQPFENPVATKDGFIFETASILLYIKRFGKNPITGGKLEAKELFPLRFHRNDEGQLHCPITSKVFTNFSKVVMNTVSGHVYSYDAVEELNKKVKNWKDLITSQPFKWSDIVVIQDPDEVEAREVAKFWYMENGQQDTVTRMLNPDMEETEEKKEKIRPNAAMGRVFEEKKRLAEEKAKEEEAKALEDGKEDGEQKSSVLPLQKDPADRKVNARYTSGDAAASFTSTARPLQSQNDLRLMTEEEELQEIYDAVRKKKLKGYVRMVTSEGLLNLEIHCNIVPRTSDNFLRLCEQDYYTGTVFHRLVHNFMIQGGDPTGTGKGGKSAWKDGKAFKDEFDARLTHQGAGVISMANNGKNTNKSQFFVTLKSCQHLDLKHSIFGRVVGGLQLLDAFNKWECDEKDRPVKEIKVLRTEVFKNPFKEEMVEAAKPKVEKQVDAVALWFSNRGDPMEKHVNRHSDSVGKYLAPPVPALPGEKRPASDALSTEEREYAAVSQTKKRVRSSFDFSNW